jgi:hypothetical protein
MLGFGALRAMNDSVKQNREMLKAGKKNFYERDLNYPLSTGEIVFKDKEYSFDVMKITRASALRNAKAEKIRALVILFVSVIITAVLTDYAWINS